MEILALLRPVILLSILAVAAVTDVLKHRVSNKLLLAGMLLEATVYAAAPVNAEPGIIGCYIVFLGAVFILFVMRLLGGADVKLYALCMLSYPNSTGMKLITASVITAAVWSVCVLTARGMLKSRLKLLQIYLIAAASGVSTACTDMADPHQNDEKAVLPMAAFIFIGACFTLMRQV